jgi:2-dehydro-3-deoxyphosphogluconate aldolase/(4S)-4-hydroxy-2-oxoglutarate aldolase
LLNRWETTSRIVESGLIVIVRADSPEQAVRIAEATLSGGASAIEITYTVPGATEVIKQLVDTYRGKDLIIGAGTVLDPETARMAILAGAQFIVGPNFNPDTVRMCNRYQIPVMPGVTTLNEAVRALEAGADILKFFPGSEFSPSVIKAIRGPLPYAPLMPTGGVNLDNVGEWIRNGSVAVGVGGSLTAGAKIGDYQGITSLTKQYVAKIREARQE